MSIQKRETAAGVRYVARYRGPDKKERSKTFERRKDAKAWIEDRERDVRRGEWIDPKLGEETVAQYGQRWRARAHTEGTKAHRKSMLDNLGPLAEFPLSEVKKGDVAAWYDSLASRPWAGGAALADSTRETLHKALTAMFKAAVADELITRSPVGRRPKTERHDQPIMEHELITPEQLAALIVAARDGVPAVKRGDKIVTPSVRAMPMFARAVLVAATSGLRPGELAGLKVRNVDFLRREIHVTEQASRVAGETQRTKSASSRRTVPVPKETIDAIAEQLAEQPRGADETVFCSSQETALTQVRLGEYFRRFRASAGIPGHSMHDLRHLYASALIRAGRSPKVVQRRLGHASASITLDTYTHLFLDDDDADREAIAGQLRIICGISTSGEGSAATG